MTDVGDSEVPAAETAQPNPIINTIPPSHPPTEENSTDTAPIAPTEENSTELQSVVGDSSSTVTPQTVTGENEQPEPAATKKKDKSPRKGRGGRRGRRRDE